MELFPYQADDINKIARLYGGGYRKLIYQLPTGGGKTVTFGGITNRFLQKYPDKDVLVTVHRDELLQQARRTFFEGFGYPSQIIGNNKSGEHRIKISMVETLNNRIKNNPPFFENVGLLIVDECHIGNFKKIYDHFPSPLILGVSATPLSSDKKDPLNNYFEEIVCGPQIKELIDLNRLVPNVTYTIKGVNRGKIRIKNGKYDEAQMGFIYSHQKHIKNCLSAYEKYAEQGKTLIFNCNIEHSKLVNLAFLEAGYDSRHLDGTESEVQRQDTLHWFKHSPNAILNNVGILTTGFDDPAIINIMVNRAMLSLPLWLQTCGRGGRACPKIDKTHFNLIDLGCNNDYFGDWSIDRDWYDIFHNPQKMGSKAAPPMKNCLSCEKQLPASTKICTYCFANLRIPIEYDSFAIDFERVVTNINTERIIARNIERGYKPFKGFYDIVGKINTALRIIIADKELTSDVEQLIQNELLLKVKEWAAAADIPYNNWLVNLAKNEVAKNINHN